jgi:guanylate kinase
LDIDLQGAQKIYKQFPECHFLFVNVPSLEELEARLKARNTETEESLAKRLKNAEKELETVKNLEYYEHIVND